VAEVFIGENLTRGRERMLGRNIEALPRAARRDSGPYFLRRAFSEAMEIDLGVNLTQMFRLPELGDLSCIGPEL
jgi:hypothetical protein